MSKIPLYSGGVGIKQAPAIRQSNTNIMAGLENSLTSAINIYAQQEQETSNLKIKNDFSENIYRISNENANDPEQMTTLLDEYKDTYLKDFSENDKLRYGTQFDITSRPQIIKSLQNKRKLLDNDIEYENRRMVDNTQRNIYSNITGLFSDNPEDQVTTAENMALDMANINQSLNAVKSDGTPVYTPQQKFKIQEDTRIETYNNISKAWFEQQPDKDLAMKQWSNNEVEVVMPTEEGAKKVNIRDFIGMDKVKVDKELRSEYTIAKKVNNLATLTRQTEAEGQLNKIMNDKTISRTEKKAYLDKAEAEGISSNKYAIAQRRVLESEKAIDAVSHAEDISNVVMQFSDLNASEKTGEDYLNGLQDININIANLRAKGYLSLEDEQLIRKQMQEEKGRKRLSKATEETTDVGLFGHIGYDYGEAKDFFDNNTPNESIANTGFRDYFFEISGKDLTTTEKKNVAHKIRNDLKNKYINSMIKQK